MIKKTIFLVLLIFATTVYAQNEIRILSKEDYIVLIDPGHGGQDTGIQDKKTTEKELTLNISKEVASKLANKGIKTSLTRATDENISIKQRLKIEKSLKPSLFLSIHLSIKDSFIIYTSTTKKNIEEAQLSKILSKEKMLAKAFMESLKQNFSEAVYFESLSVTLLKESTVPALVIEIPKKALYSDKSYVDKIINVFVQVISEKLKNE